MCDYDEYKDYPDLADVAYGHGFAFGKYLVQTTLDERFLGFLANNPQALMIYHDNYNQGFNAGFADNPSDFLIF